MADISPEYLSKEFDVYSLTISKLKTTLSQMGVQLPMKQERKQFYVDLFQKHITHRADEIKAKRTVKPSSSGIIDVTTADVTPSKVS